VPSPYIESDGYTGGPAGLTYGRVAYTHAPGVTGIDEPIAITRIGSTSESVPDPMTVYPHTGWRGMLAVGTMDNGNVSDCGYSGSGTCAPIDWPAIDATVDKGPSGSNEPQSWFGSLASANSEGSGLSYKRNRYYDPARGQFTQADPIGLAGGLNVYGFAEGDPVNFDDPFGLETSVNCRQVGGSGNTGVVAHCAIRVRDSDRGVDVVIELQPSEDNKKEINWRFLGDKERGRYDARTWTQVSVPKGMSSAEFDRAILNAVLVEHARQQGTKYTPLSHGNSNRFVNNVVTRASGQVPRKPAARFIFGAPGLCKEGPSGNQTGCVP
jgi:RHS repeat-associated protein